MNQPNVKIGLEVFLKQPPQVLRGVRIGLLLNQASLDSNLKLSCDAIADRFPGQLKCLFSPQHGIWGEQQANMIETQHGYYQPLGLPVYSLYSETRRPTDAMLGEIDCLVIDLQDVGTRVYTFIWTMLEVLKACHQTDKSVVILDRPNPIGGLVSEGAILQSDYLSFVGGASIPLRHALTMAELAQWLKAKFRLEVDLHCVPMQGWQRWMWMDQTGLRWIWPSPNMPSLSTALVYPGQVLLEGVNLSEGRGTTRPFEVVGAPFIDTRQWLSALEPFGIQGVRFLPTRFQPTFDKFSKQSCEGLDLQILDRDAFRSVSMTIALIATAAKHFPEFRWLEPPYEYEQIKPPIDILYGSDQLRKQVKDYCHCRINEDELLRSCQLDQATWQREVAPYQLY